MKKILLILCVVSFMGCASWVVQPQKVVLLPEERIFTIPAGQVIDVLLDKEPLSMTFPYDMKLVSPSVLVRQEQQLNDATFKKIKAEKRNSGIMAALTAIFGAIGGVIGIWVKNKAKAPKK
jgi:hypothetical protein